MAIGTGLALLGAAAISAGAGALSSKSQNKANKQANQIVQEDNAANRALATEIYGRNVGYLSPWMASGQQANSARMELLGFPGAAPQPAAFGAYGGTGTYGGAPMPAPSAFAGFPMAANDPGIGRVGLQNGREFAGDFGESAFGSPGFGGGTFGPEQMSVPGGVTVPMPAARSAFDTYRGSTGYDFRFNEGIRALQSAFSRNLESGASTKAAMRFGQGIGSDEFARYMELLGDQSRLGLSGASALAGVGQQYGNTVTAGNNAAASAAANARLYAGQNNALMWQNLGSSFGNALGKFSG